MSTETRNLPALNQVKSVDELILHPGAARQVQKVASDVINPERFVRLMTTAFRKVPKLKQCEPMSFLGALMELAHLGLEPNTSLGHAWILPFDVRRYNKDRGQWEVIRTDAQVVIGYRGLVELARRSDRVKSIQAGVHYSDDEEWVYRQGTDPVLDHVPGPQQGELLHAYAIVHYLAGGYDMVVWPWAKVEAHRDQYSVGWKTAVANAKRYNKPIDSPWVTATDAMGMKTMVRQLARWMPLSANTVRRAMEVDGGKLDYRGFAQNPEAGPATIEGDYVPIDDTPPETDGEGDEAPDDMIDGSAEAKPAEQPPAEEKAEKKADPKPARRSRKAEPKAEAKTEKPAEKAKDEAPAEKGGEGEAQDEVDPALQSLHDLIIADLKDAGSYAVKAALDLHRENIARIEKEAPELGKAVEQAIVDAENGKFDPKEEK